MGEVSLYKVHSIEIIRIKWIKNVKIGPFAGQYLHCYQKNL